MRREREGKGLGLPAPAGEGLAEGGARPRPETADPGYCPRCAAPLPIVDECLDGTPVHGACSRCAAPPLIRPAGTGPRGREVDRSGPVAERAAAAAQARAAGAGETAPDPKETILARRAASRRAVIPGSPSLPTRDRGVRATAAQPARTPALRCERCGQPLEIVDETPDGRPVVLPCACAAVAVSDRAGKEPRPAPRPRQPAAPRPLLGGEPPVAPKRSRAGGVALSLAIIAAAMGILTRFPGRESPAPGGIAATSRKAPRSAGAILADEIPREQGRVPDVELVRIETDGSGRVTRIEGPTPEAVLAALCEQPALRGRRGPGAVAPASPPSPNARRAILTALDPSGKESAIVIRRQARTGRWWIGDGKSPIEIDGLPAFAPARDEREGRPERPGEAAAAEPEEAALAGGPER